jgi:hypothetical protein
LGECHRQLTSKNGINLIRKNSNQQWYSKWGQVIGTQSLVPIIKVTALHGTGTQGLGNEPLMSPGIHQVHLNITGTTRHNNVDTNVSLVASAMINALVMNVNIHAGSQVIDLASPPGELSGGATIDNFNVFLIPGYIDSTDSIVTVVNNGNVNLKIKTVDMNINSDSSSYAINVSDSVDVIVHSDQALYFVLDGHNTVIDPNKLQLQSNGKAYFFIRNSK